jgi:hypothetical protein
VGVHLRRAILLFALVLGLTALAAAVSPTRDDDSGGGGNASVAPAPAASQALPRQIVLDARRVPRRGSGVVRARENEHVVVVVRAADGGLATIPQLGRTGSVSAAAAARFDLLGPAPGRYDVMFEAAGSGEPRRVGTLVTRP